jgi:hypothetical protein
MPPSSALFTVDSLPLLGASLKQFKNVFVFCKNAKKAVIWFHANWKNK